MRKYRDYLIEKLSDREEAIVYLQVSLEEYQADGNTAAFLLALRTVSEAQGELPKTAKNEKDQELIDQYRDCFAELNQFLSSRQISKLAVSN